MGRIAVVTVLTALQLASPLLCCCTVARAAASFTRAAEAQPASSELPPCCCHKAAQGGQGQTAPDQPHKRQSPARPACPCRQCPTRNAALAPDTEAGKQLPQRQPSDDLTGSLSFAPPGHALAYAGDVPFRNDAGNRPFLTAAQILRAFHILRC